LNGAIDELQWLPYAKRINMRRTKASQPGTTSQTMIQDNTRALINVGNQLSKLDALAPALTSLSGRIGNMETLLKNVTDALRGTAPSVPVERRRTARHEK
jgi:hypothetical protein